MAFPAQAIFTATTVTQRLYSCRTYDSPVENACRLNGHSEKKLDAYEK